METIQGIEQTIGVVPGGTQPSKKSVIRSQLWKESTEKFMKGEPKVLGAVQVMIALINLSIGIILICTSLRDIPPISLILGVPAWGPLMFIISGSLSIAAAIKPTKRLVTVSLVFNTISAVLAITASIMSVVSVVVCLHTPRLNLVAGIDSLMLILNLLEFCIAVSVSAFGCKVTCCDTSEVVVVQSSNPARTAMALPVLLQPLAPPEYQGINVPENPTWTPLEN
ncbi:membrane-spanning 4-domains subfamily A member 4D-like [Psammomys obesus]|uniref:membrane-spanning 4-domains subfamily A member 4D-like n=1 Tax=Psammomys obesus TaxID=48139 RepID=UPI002452C376|nr:membrane-spanning 4-domains subfamily A member 4D-like [Psammomys obesus]